MTDVLDSILLQGNFSTPAVRAIWSDENKIKKQLKVEASLSKIEGQLDVIPQKSADKIVSIASIENFNIKDLAKEAQEKRHSLIALVHRLQTLAGDEDGEYVHFGVTTQDIVDTGTVLQVKEAYDVLLKDSKNLIAILKVQTNRYRDTIQIGRTHGIQAIPTTFGFKLAVWLDELVRDHKRLVELKSRNIFVGNINGAIGTYAGFGAKGPEIEQKVLEDLELDVPTISWQASRDRLAEFATVIGIYSGTLGKIGHELFNLMRTEINEIQEPFKKGEVGSSTMPQKRNPALIESLAALTQPILKDVGLMLETMEIDSERDSMHWRNEWIVLPEITNYLDTQLTLAATIIKDLQVNESQMLRNVNLQNGLPFAEHIMFNVGVVIGKQSAHELVYKSAMKAIEQHENFLDILYEQPEIKKEFTRDELRSWTDPTKVLGSISVKIDDVLNKANEL